MKFGQLYYLREQCQGHGHLTRERLSGISFLPACQYKHSQPFHLSLEVKNHWQTTLCLYLGSSYCSVWNDRSISGKPGWNLRMVFLLGSRTAWNPWLRGGLFWTQWCAVHSWLVSFITCWTFGWTKSSLEPRVCEGTKDSSHDCVNRKTWKISSNIILSIATSCTFIPSLVHKETAMYFWTGYWYSPHK